MSSSNAIRESLKIFGRLPPSQPQRDSVDQREPMVRVGGLVAPDVRAFTIDSDDSIDAAVVVDVPDSLAMDTLIY